MLNNDYGLLYERAAYYYNWILNSKAGEYARLYLEKRGISLTIANNFLLGASPYQKADKNWFDYRTNTALFELSGNADVIDIINSKLARTVIDESTNRVEVFDFFTTNRIIMPVISNGRPVYFTSRTTGVSKLKHRHLSGCSSMTNIFNLDILKSDAREIYITEGIFDALTLTSIGKNAIATLGTRGISFHDRELFPNKQARYIFVYDNDKNDSGDKAVNKSAAILKSFGINALYKITLPRKATTDKTDINQMLCKCLKTGETHEYLREYFDNITREPLDVTVYQKPVGNNYNANNNAQIYQVVSDYAPNLIKLSPTTFRTLCPFSDHADTEPSFVVYTNTNSYFCFGCGKNGGPSKFLEELLGINYKEANQMLKEKYDG